MLDLLLGVVALGQGDGEIPCVAGQSEAVHRGRLSRALQKAQLLLKVHRKRFDSEQVHN